MGNEFQGQTFDIKNINGGEKYKDGDGIGANAINAPIESALYMQNLGTNAPDISEIGGSGTPNVEIVKDASGNPKFKFSNLKGAQGEQGIQGEQGYFSIVRWT